MVFTLQANYTSIQKVTQTLIPGENTISFFCNFVPISTEKLPIYLKIEPKEQKPVYLQSASIFVWGTSYTSEEVKYQGIELDSQYLISLVYFQTIYYKLTQKNSNEFVLEDLEEFADGISCCFVYSKDDDKVYYFRISSNNELFFSELGKQEKFIMQGVSDVTACLQNNAFFVFILINEICYTFQIDKNGNWSMPTKLNTLNLKVKSLYAYMASNINRIYLNVTSTNGENYLFEQISESTGKSEKINASYKIEFYISGNKI